MPEPTEAVALVTGGSGVLGRAICHALDRAGFRVAIHYAGNEDGAVLTQKGCVHESVVCQADVASWHDVQVMEGFVRERLGPVAVLVNNAAVRHDGLLAGQSRDDWCRTIDVNLVGTFHTCRAVLGRMVAARWGRVVNVVSPIASIPNPGQTAYAASKAGVVALTRTLAQECGRRGITVNAVSPGFMPSPMVDALPDEVFQNMIARTAIRRPVRPDEVAAAVRFIVDSPALTGAVVPLDGGFGG